MSLEYACIYHEKGLCLKDEEPGYVNYCVFGPCAAETPSRGDLIRRMDDQELARYLYALANSDFELKFCQNRPECQELVDTDGCVPEENCLVCLIHYLKQPEEKNSVADLNKAPQINNFGGDTMNNYIVINGRQIELTEEQAKKLERDMCLPDTKLSDFAAGDIVRIGSHEMIVLEHVGGATLLLRKDLLDKVRFGDNNNYAGSNADALCNDFAEEIAEIVGEDNILLHDVDLTADDGLKDYGVIQRKASLLTAQQCRTYVEILDKHKLNRWWWLATAFSTPAHENDCWVKCVSPSGCIYYYYYINGDFGVRPFCILKSDIFVSK